MPAVTVMQPNTQMVLIGGNNTNMLLCLPNSRMFLLLWHLWCLTARICGLGLRPMHTFSMNITITSLMFDVASWSFTMYKCDPTTQNESHWYSVTIQNATIFDLQVENIDFRFSSKSGASDIFLFENITVNGQMWCFMTVSGILFRHFKL